MALAILFTTYSFSQISENYKVQLDSALWKYNSKIYNPKTKKNEWIFNSNRKEPYVIQDKLLRENTSEAFSYVIFSSSDLSTNASAFGYTQNKEKTTVAINTNFRIGNKLSPLYIRAGANASGSKNIFEFYSEESWRNNVGLNAGIILRIGKSAFFKGKSFASVHNRRKIFGGDPIYNSNKYSSITAASIINLKNEILNFDGNKNLLTEYKTLLDVFPKIQKLLKERKYDEGFGELEKEEKNIKKLNKAIQDDDLKKYIENTVLYNFDKENDITYGYSFLWFDFNLNLGNSNYKFTEDSIDIMLVEDFNNSFDLIDDINKLKSSLTLNYNHTHNAEKSIWFYQIGLGTKSGSFLENSLLNGTPKIVQNESGDFIIQDENKQNFGLYENIDKTMSTGIFNAYGAIFFTKNKNFGFNISANHEYLIKKPNGSNFRNNFTTLFGPIFRKTEDDRTTLTFGIDIGWENGVYGEDVTNDFTGRIRVGVPFNIYTKKKKNDKKYE